MKTGRVFHEGKPKKIEREETTVKESQKKEEYRGRQDSNLRGQIQHDF